MSTLTQTETKTVTDGMRAAAKAIGGFDRLELRRNAPQALLAFANAERVISESAPRPGLYELVRLRASQINGCGFCVVMHTEDAMAGGETAERLSRVVVWRDVEDFTDAERAALAWTEAVTRLDNPGSLGRLHADLEKHFTAAEIGALTAAVAMINVWNRLQVASHGGRPRVAG